MIYIWSQFDSGSDIAEPGPMFPFNQIPNQFASKASALSVPHHLLHIFSCQCLLHFVWDFILEILGVFMNRLFGDVWSQSEKKSDLLKLKLNYCPATSTNKWNQQKQSRFKISPTDFNMIMIIEVEERKR